MILIVGINDICKIFFILGVIPKAVMDSTEFLMNFNLPKDAKKGLKRRHSFKGKTKYISPQKNALQKIASVSLALFSTKSLLRAPKFHFLKCLK